MKYDIIDIYPDYSGYKVANKSIIYFHFAEFWMQLNLVQSIWLQVM